MLGFFTRQAPAKLEWDYTGGQTTNQNRLAPMYGSIGISAVQFEWDINNADPTVTYTNNNNPFYKMALGVSAPRSPSSWVVYINKTGASAVKKRTRHYLLRPDMIYTIQVTGNGLTQNANYYTFNGAVDIDLHLFSKLIYFLVGGAYLPVFKPFPNALKEIHFNNSQVAALPNLPQELRIITILATTVAAQALATINAIVAHITSISKLEVFRNVSLSYTAGVTFWKTLTLSADVSPYTSTALVLNLSTNPNLTEIALETFTVGGFNFPATLENLERFWVRGSNNAIAITGVNINNLILSIGEKAQCFLFMNYNLNGQAINITNLKNLELINLYKCKLTGSVDLSTPHPKLKSFTLGDISQPNYAYRNVIPSVNLSGCSSIANINLADTGLQTLILPATLPELENLYINYNILQDQVIDLTTASKLVNLYIGTATVAGMGMTGTNFNVLGLTNKPALANFYAGDTKLNQALDFTGCNALVNLYAYNTNINALTLPATNTLVILYAYLNPLLKTINRIPTTVNQYNIWGCDFNELPVPNSTIAFTTLAVGNGVDIGQIGDGIEFLSLQGFGSITNLYLNHSKIRELTFSTVLRNHLNTRIHSNRLEVINWNAVMFPDQATNSIFYSYDNATYRTIYPTGTKINTRTIHLGSNYWTQNLVDEQIRYLWNNRGNINAATTNGFNNTVAKALTINGNAIPSGTLGVPATGYTGNIHDQTDAVITAASVDWTPLQLVWALVNLQISSGNATKRYKWTVTYATPVFRFKTNKGGENPFTMGMTLNGATLQRTAFFYTGDNSYTMHDMLTAINESKLLATEGEKEVQVHLISSVAGIQAISVVNAGIVGAFDLRNSLWFGTNTADKIITITDNPSLTSVIFQAHTAVANNYPSYDLSRNNITGVLDLSTVLNLRRLVAANNPLLTGVTFSVTTASSFIELQLPNCNLTGTLNLSTISAAWSTLAILVLRDNPLLTGITFPTTIRSFADFQVQNCALNIAFLFGTKINWGAAATFNISNNGMSVANVDASIANLYTNKAVFNATFEKTLIMTGNNAVPTGIYQQPAGFVFGGADGTPASPMEQKWVLENQTNTGIPQGGVKKYKFIITTN